MQLEDGEKWVRAFICLHHAGKGTLREVCVHKNEQSRRVAQEPDKGNWGWHEVACAWGGDTGDGDLRRQRGWPQARDSIAAGRHLTVGRGASHGAINRDTNGAWVGVR